MGRSARVTPQAPGEPAGFGVDGADSDLTLGGNETPEPAGARRPPAEPIRTMIVDDHALFRRGLEMVLASEPDIDLVGEASDGEEAVSKAGESLPDVVLMDIRMPRSSGIEACRALKEVAPSAKITSPIPEACTRLMSASIESSCGPTPSSGDNVPPRT